MQIKFVKDPDPFLLIHFHFEVGSGTSLGASVLARTIVGDES